MGALTSAECGVRNAEWQGYFEELVKVGRAGVLQAGSALWVAAERVPMLAAVFPDARCEPTLSVPERDRAKAWTREDAVRELVRGRLEAVGPTTAADVATSLGLALADVDFALGALEHEGFVLRGRFTPAVAELEWCERRLLARIHRYTLDRLRQEIEPVTASEFLQFLACWQHVDESYKLEGPRGVAEVLNQLAGFEVPAWAWEMHVLSRRVRDYRREWLEEVTLGGEFVWGRFWGGASSAIRVTPISFAPREHLDDWLALTESPLTENLSGPGSDLLHALTAHGPMFPQN